MTKEEWVRVSTHPYKVHPQIKAGGVPGLILFQGANEISRIEDSEKFQSEETMDMLLTD